MTSHTRTVSPSTHPRPASGGATDFLLASALSCSPTGLATSRWRRRAMRPTDVCHPIELRAPAPRAFLAPHVTFVAGTSHGVLGSVRHDQGTGRFTTPERPLRRIGNQHEPHAPGLAALVWRVMSVGVFFPRR